MRPGVNWNVTSSDESLLPVRTDADEADAAHEAAHVGDSIQNDIEPALKMGMTAVLRRNGGPNGNGAHHEVDSLEELPAVFGVNAGL